MSKLFEIPVRGGEDGFPVFLCREEETGRLVIRAINEAGYSCVDLDFRDLARWFGVNPDERESALTASEHSR